MDGLLRAISDGISGMFDGVLGAISSAIGSVGTALSAALAAGGLPVIVIGAVVILGIWLLIRR